MTREDIAGLLASWRDAVDRRDAIALADLHADDSVMETVMAGTVTGRAAIVEVYEAWFKAFPDMVLTSDEPLIDGDRVAQVHTVVGTDLGGFMGTPPTSRPFRLPMVFLYTIRDGYVVHGRTIYDFTGLLVQIGVLKAKPA
ncbi:MAG: hypothetical protein HW394_910 [Acidobacteria bacterium]|nr:hypothetical protein [Acidobacteriota bacterium]